jgi:cyanamide hydratase
MSDPVATYGLTALPADLTATAPSTSSPSPVTLSEIPYPTSPLAARIHAYAKSALSPDTYRHSLRVYSYGRAIALRCFPQWKLTTGSPLDETWFLTAMLHDIGTTDEHIHSTRLSYEFWAGVHALDILQDSSLGGVATKDQAESIAEAIIRHQDVQDVGSITLITRLIHLGTLLDNIGAASHLVHPETIDHVVKAYPRPGWSGCFKGTVELEKKLKPWTMVSRIDGFEEKIEANGKDGLMADYEP